MVWEHSFTIESQESPSSLYRKLLEYYTRVDYPFKIVEQRSPNFLKMKRGSHWGLGGSWKKLKSTLNITLTSKEESTTILLHYGISGATGAMGYQEKAKIEVEHFKMNYL